MKTAVKAAAAGVSAAVCVVLMFLGGMLYIFTYAVPMILGVLMTAVKKTFSASCALCVYFAVSALSFILVPEKEMVLMYVLFFGWYPLAAGRLSHIRPKLVSYAVKLILFAVCIAAVEFIAFYVFGIPFFEDGVFSAAMLALFAVLMCAAFVLYDLMLSKFLLLYEKRLESRVMKIFRR